jgi:hypothetical protein
VVPFSADPSTVGVTPLIVENVVLIVPVVGVQHPAVKLTPEKVEAAFTFATL